MTREEFNSQLQDISTDIEDIYQPTNNKLDTLAKNKDKKLTKLSAGITGMYDADSPYAAETYQGYNQKTKQVEDKSTYRLSGDGYYLQAPELKVDGKLNQAGINARIQADNYAMGVDAPNFAEGEGLEPRYYEQYKQAMDPVLRDRSQNGEYEVMDTGGTGYYGRKLVQAQSKEMPMSQTEYLLGKGQGDRIALQQNTGTDADNLAKYYASQDSVDTDGMLGEAVDIGQSSLVQQYAKTNKALRKGSRWLADKLGVDEATIDKILPKTEDVGTIGFGEQTSTELANAEVADKLMGVMAKTREEQAEGHKASGEALKKGDYIGAVWEQIKILPYTLGDSTGEVAAIMAGYPGVATAIAARVSEDAEEYEKNNKVKPDSEWLLGSTLLNASALLGEKFLVKSGIGGVIEKGVSKAGRTGGVAASTVGEAAQEWFDQTQQMYMTQKEGEQTLGEVATSDEAKLAALAGGVAGGALRGAGEAGKGTIEGLKAGKTALGEYVVHKNESQTTGDETERALTSRGAENRFHSVGSEGFEVKDDRARQVYAQDVSRHAAEVWNSPEVAERSGYTGRPKEVLEDAAEKIMSLYGLEGDTAKGVITAEVVKNIVAEMKQTNEETNKPMASKEEINEFVKGVAQAYGNNESVKLVAQEMYESQIKDEIADYKSTLTDKELEAAENLKLDEGTVAKIKATLDDMRALGSEDTTEYANEIDKALEMHQNAEEGQDADRPKTMEEVEAEVLITGFISGNGEERRSIPQHAAAMKQYVAAGEIEATKEARADTLKKFTKFAESRLGKVKPVKMVKNKLKTNELDQVMRFVRDTTNETKQLLDIANKTMNSKDISEADKSKLEEVSTKMQAELDKMQEITNLRNSGKLVEAYMKILEYYGDEKAKSRLDVQEHIKALKLREEAKKEPTVEEIADLIEKKAGKANEYTAEEQQIVENAKDDGKLQEVNKVLSERAKKVEPIKVEVEYEKAKLGEEVSEYKVAKETPTSVEQVAESIASTKEQVQEVQDKIEQVQKDTKSEEAGTTLEKLNAELDNLDKILEAHNRSMKQLVSKRRVLQDRVKKHESLMYRWQRQLNEARKELSKAQKNSVLKLAMAAFNLIKEMAKELGKMGYLVNKHAKEWELAKQELKKVDEKVQAKEQAKVEQRVNKQKEKIVGELLAIPEVVGALKQAKMKGLSTTMVMENAESGERYGMLMKIMPAIISKSETGIERVQEAVKVLEAYGARRADIELPLQVTKVTEQDKKDAAQKLFGRPTKNAKEKAMAAEEAGKGNNPLVKHGIAKVLKENEQATKQALHVAALVMYNKVQDVQTMNNQQLENTIEGAFGSLYKQGMDEADKEHWKNELKSGRIVPAAMYYQQAGQVLMRELGVKLDSELTQSEKMNVTAAMGMMVIGDMLKVPGEKVNGAKLNMAYVDVNGEIQVGTTESAQGQGVNVIDLREFAETKSGREALSMFKRAGGTLEFASAKDEPQVSLEPIKYTKEKARNTETPLSADVKEYLSRQGSMAWRFGEDSVEMLESYRKDGKIDVEKLKLHILGDLDKILKGTAAMNAASEHAKYEADALQVERMVEVYEMVKESEFYIGWDHTKSGRNMMDSMWINPQNSKISRFVVSAKDMATEVDMTNEKSRMFVLAAAAQALDLDIDKKPDEVVLAGMADKYFSIDENGKVKLAKNEKFNKAVNEPTLANVRAMHPTMVPGELMHQWQLVKLLNKLKDGPKAETTLALEEDGITNGMSAMLMQLGFTESSKEHVAKTGMYVKGEYEYKNHAEYMSKGGVDIYSTPIEKIKENVDKETADEITSILGGEGKWRSFMKGPVMIFIYGAGMANIKKSIARSLITGNSYIKGGMSTGKIEEIAQLAGVEMQDGKLMIETKSKTVPVKLEYKVYDAKTGKLELAKNEVDMVAENIVLPEWVVGVLTKKIEENIGDAFEKSFKENFGELIEFRQALKVVEEMSYLVYKSEVGKYLKQLGKKNVSDLTGKQLDKMNAKLLEDGTYYGANNSTGGVQDYVKLEKAEGSGNISVRIPNREGKSGVGNLTSSDYVKELVANVGAVGVITIHDIDGATMVTGHTKDVLNIYDALMLGVSPEVNTKQMQDMNRMFFKLNTEHSILGKAVKKLVKSADKMEVVDANEVEQDLRRIFGMKKESLDEVVAELDKVVGVLGKVHENRKAMKGKPVLANQYYGTDLIPGVEMVASKVEAVYEHANMYEQMKVMENLVKQVKDKLLDGDVQVEPKQEDGKIEATNAIEETGDNARKDAEKVC